MFINLIFRQLLNNFILLIQSITFAFQNVINNTNFVFQNNVVILPLHNAHWMTLFNLRR